MKRMWSYILARFAGLLVVATMALLYAVQTPKVQTKLSRKAVSKFEEMFAGRLTYSELGILPSGALILKDALLIDREPYSEDEFERGWQSVDTVFYAKSISATFTLRTLFEKKGLHFGKVDIHDGYFHFTTEPGEYSNNITRIFKLKPSGKEKTVSPDIFDIRKAAIHGFRFRLNNFKRASRKEIEMPSINYDDMDITFSATGSRLKFSGSRMFGRLDWFMAKEKSGYEIEELSGSFAVGLGKTEISNLHLRDKWSDFRLKRYSMAYANAKAFSNYIEEVRMSADFRPGSIAMKTISYFAGIFPENKSVFEVKQGHFEGYTNDFSVSAFEFTDSYSRLAGQIDACQITGLPEVSSMLMDINVRNMTFTVAGLGRFLDGFRASLPKNVREMAKGCAFNLRASLSGPVNRLKAHGTVTSKIGNLSLSADLRNLLDRRRDIEIGGSITASAIDLHHLTSNAHLGRASFHTDFGTILKKGIPDIHVDSLSISSLEAFGYNYSGISAKADITSGKARISARSIDPNLLFGLKASADLSNETGVQTYSTSGAISNVDLHALNIDKRGVSRMALNFDGDFTSRDGFIYGEASTSDIILENSIAKNEIGGLNVRAYRYGDEQHINLESGFANLKLCATNGFSDMVEDVMNITLRKELGALYSDGGPNHGTCGHYGLDLQLLDSRKLLSFFAPGLYVADSSHVKIDISKDGLLYGSVTSPRLAYNATYIKNAVLDFDNEEDGLYMHLKGDNIRSGKIEMREPRLNAMADDNAFSISMNFAKVPGISEGGDFLADGLIYRDSTNTLVIKAHPMNSYLSAGQTVWNLGESDIAIRGSDIYVDNFNITSGAQSIVIDGGISKDRSDTLFLNISKLDLSQVDEFLPKKYGLKGMLDGRAFLNSDFGKALGMLADIRVDSLKVGGADAGNFQFAAILENQGEDIELFLRNEIGGRDAFYGSGLYYPEDGRMDISAELNKFPLGSAKVFLEDIFDSMDGSLSGKLRIQGPPSRLSTTSNNLRIEDLTVKVGITGVSYTVNGPLKLDSSGLHFNSLSISDNENGSATFDGALTFDHLKDFRIDSKLNISAIKVVDAPEEKGRPVYGLLRVGGDASISGPLNSIGIDGNIYTVGSGQVHIPTEGLAGTSTSDLLTFTDKPKELDPYEEMIQAIKPGHTARGDISIRADVGINPSVKAFIEIDKSSGNVASFSGAGNISIALRPSKAIFNLNGDFIINEGSYQFSIPSIISKEFSIQNGSSVKFGGPLADTELDITANYNLKASIAPLMPDTQNDGIKRAVECGLTISDRLRNPSIKFSINVPDLNPTTRSQVESALATEDKLQKQFIALLLMGSFIPDESSGVFNGSDVLLSNVTGLMASQLNSILQKLDIPLDVGIGYQGLADGNNVFDVAISTQLFNDRVIVGGSVANRKYNNTAGNSDMIGDLDIQIKLDPEGRFRFNLFSHSADEYSSYLDLSQRNGVGVSYQKEFSRFKQIFRNLFRKNDKNEVPVQKEQTIIKIENDEIYGETLPDTGAAGR
ncbi:MAG TPA: hypothetical protein DDX33_06580 [Rikenellaceae bacterium]|nr:hypothetical protein [Rikenellaceae bacterium]